MKYKKRALVFGVLLGIFLFLGSFILADKDNPGHSGDEIFISINEYSMTLQEAIDEEFLKDNADGTDKLNIPFQDYSIDFFGGYHNGDSIYVYLGSEGQKSIQDAINNDLSFCREQGGLFGNWFFSFGHSSDDIKVNYNGQEVTFQDLIDSSEFCSYAWEEGGFGACSVTCGIGTQTQSVVCKRSDGALSNLCDPLIKPPESRSCDTGVACVIYSWKDGDWGVGSGNICDCNTGLEKRNVWCEGSDGEIMQDETLCPPPKLDESRSCVDENGDCGWGGWALYKTEPIVNRNIEYFERYCVAATCSYTCRGTYDPLFSCDTGQVFSFSLNSKQTKQEYVRIVDGKDVARLLTYDDTWPDSITSSSGVEYFVSKQTSEGKLVLTAIDYYYY